MGQITLNKVDRAYGKLKVLHDINLDIPDGEFTVLVGPSGCGKSTLLRLIAGLDKPTSGEIIIDDDNVLEMNDTKLREFRRFKASMVFQRFALLPHRTIASNVAYGLTIQEVAEEEASERSQKWINRVGLAGFENHYPAQLSGGMQQRVGLARALATNAEILLMDEAFSALDPLIRTDMQDVLLGLQEELHKTIVFITHDLDEALRIGDSIAILRDGAIVQKGSPQDIILQPVNDYVADFTKDINRGRVLKVASIMDSKQAPTGSTDSMIIPKIEQNMVIEDALQLLSAAGDSTAIVTHDAKAVGSVDRDKMIAALARPNLGKGRIGTYR